MGGRPNDKHFTATGNFCSGKNHTRKTFVQSKTRKMIDRLYTDYMENVRALNIDPNHYNRVISETVLRFSALLESFGFIECGNILATLVVDLGKFE